MDTLRHILKTKLGNKYKTCLSLALEIERSEINLEEIEQNLKELKEKINGIPSPFNFNLDECGYTDYADTREKKLIVPISYSKMSVTYPVSRKMKHSSVLECISPC